MYKAFDHEKDYKWTKWRARGYWDVPKSAAVP